MKGSTIFTALAATALLFATAAASAQNQQGSAQQGAGQQGGAQQGSGQQQMRQQQRRQAERAMSQDQVMDQTRLQSRERTQDREQTQTQAQAPQGKGEGIYGGNLMTAQERNQYRAELGAQKTDEERLEYKARHREKMELRAKERGIDPEVTDD
jgi:opacity protein-like surface antigen